MRRRREADAPLLSASQVGDADAFTYVVTKRGEPFADVEPSFRARVAARAEKLEAGGKFFDAEIPITPPRAGRVLRLRLLSHKAGGLRDGAAALLFVEARDRARPRPRASRPSRPRARSARHSLTRGAGLAPKQVRLAQPLSPGAPARAPALDAKPPPAAAPAAAPGGDAMAIAVQVGKAAEKRVLAVVDMALTRMEERIAAKLGALEARVATIEATLGALPAPPPRGGDGVPAPPNGPADPPPPAADAVADGENHVGGMNGCSAGEGDT